ncbi:MAG TPA: glycosyltransferase family 4 protein [Thermoleophilaceae bacterium]
MSVHTLVVFHLGGVGGPAASVRPIATWLAERGTVETIVPQPGAVADEYAALGPVSVARHESLTFARRPPEAARLARRLARDVRGFRGAIRRRRPDLVLAITTTLPALAVAARLEGVPVVVYAAEIYDQGWKGSRLPPTAGRLLAELTARSADGIVCPSPAVAAQFPRRAGIPVAVAHPPIDGSYAHGDRERGRERYGVRGADPCVAVVGALSRGRGQDVALRALRLVRRRLPAARLLLVGAPHPRPVDLEYAAELRALAGELGVADAVVFAGATASIPDVYASADLVVNPARVAESFGRVAAEALVASRPVVASRVGALEEVVRDGVDGVLVDPDDPEALAAAIVALWEDPGLRERLVTAGREAVAARFTVEANREAWRTVLERVVPGLSTPRGRSRPPGTSGAGS